MGAILSGSNNVTSILGGGSGGGTPVDTIRRTGWWQLQQMAATTTAAVNTAVTVDNAGGLGELEDAGGAFVAMTGPASPGVGGWRSTASHTQGQLKPRMVARVRTSSTLADQRIWVGAFQTLPTSTDAATGNLFCFRYSSIAGDTNWKCLTNDGSTPTVADSGIPVAVDTAYNLKMDMSSGTSVIFSVNNVVVQTIATTLPAASISLAFVIRICPTTAATRTFYKGYMAWDSN